MTGWKSILLRAVGVGLGFGIACIVAGSIYIYVSTRPPAWNSNALKATYSSLYFNTGDALTIVFHFSVKNDSGRDYDPSITPGDLFVVSDDHNGLYQPNTSEDPYLRDMSVTGPPFIPTGEAGLMTVTLFYNYPNDYTKADRDDMSKMAKFVANRLKFLAGFVVLDRDSHYKLTVSNDGWKKAPDDIDKQRDQAKPK